MNSTSSSYNITLEVSEKSINSDKEQFENIIKNKNKNKNKNIILGDAEMKNVDTEEEEEEIIAKDEEIIELFNIKIKGHPCEYYTDNAANGYIYEIGKLDEIGPIVGKFVNGKANMNEIN